MPEYEILHPINLGLEKLDKGEKITLSAFSGNALVEEGAAKEVGPAPEDNKGSEDDNPGGEDNGATVTKPENETKTEGSEEQEKAIRAALASQYANADDLREAAKAAGVEVAWNAGKEKVIDKIIEEGKADAVLN
jgi:hypothetical protein